MILRPRAERPVIFALFLGDGKVVDARDPPPHQAILGEFPVLVAIASEPVAAVVVPFIGEPNGDAVVAKGPQFLDQPIVELAIPLACQEGDDLLAPAQKLRAVPPHAVLTIGERDSLWTPRVPGILGLAHLLDRGLKSERRERRALFAHGFTRWTWHRGRCGGRGRSPTRRDISRSRPNRSGEPALLPPCRRSS